MKIKLDDKHYLNSDGLCYWISIEVRSNTDKLSYRRVSGYQPTYQRAVESYIDRYVTGSEAQSLKALAEDIDKLKQTVEDWEIQLKGE
jgi:hypothetical protein